jgi:hypothetical protein
MGGADYRLPLSTYGASFINNWSAGVLAGWTGCVPLPT